MININYTETKPQLNENMEWNLDSSLNWDINSKRRVDWRNAFLLLNSS